MIAYLIVVILITVILRLKVQLARGHSNIDHFPFFKASTSVTQKTRCVSLAGSLIEPFSLISAIQRH